MPSPTAIENVGHRPQEENRYSKLETKTKPMETTANLPIEPTLESTQFWYVYLLQCHNGKVYVGCTSNLDERLRRHRNGEVSFTSKLLSVKLICYTAFPDEYKVFTFERYLKSGSGRAFARRHWR